jgi:hypothetical protein
MQGLKTTRVKNTGKREKTKAVYEGSGWGKKRKGKTKNNIWK